MNKQQNIKIKSSNLKQLNNLSKVIKEIKSIGQNNFDLEVITLIIKKIKIIIIITIINRIISIKIRIRSLTH